MALTSEQETGADCLVRGRFPDPDATSVEDLTSVGLSEAEHRACQRERADSIVATWRSSMSDGGPMFSADNVEAWRMTPRRAVLIDGEEIRLSLATNLLAASRRGLVVTACRKRRDANETRSMQPLTYQKQ